LRGVAEGEPAEGAVSPRLQLVRDEAAGARPAGGVQLKPRAPERHEVVKVLAGLVGAEHFERYFLGQTRLRMHDGHLEVTTPSTYIANILERRFTRELLQATGAVTVRFVADRAAFVHGGQGGGHGGGQAGAGASGSPGSGGQGVGQRPAERRAGPQWRTFADWVEGLSNRVATQAVRRLVEEGSAGAVFVHGACGNGKTHLLQAAAGLCMSLRPGAKVRYTTAEAFTNEYIAAVRGNSVEKFRSGYRGLDLLCIDDVQFVARKEATQSEVLHTFDAIGVAGGRVLLASDEHPRTVRDFSDKLVSRFLGCTVVELTAPDQGLRSALIQSAATRRGLVLDARAVESIGRRAGPLASVRDITGVMNQLEAGLRVMWSALGNGGGAGHVVTPEVVLRVLGDRGVERGVASSGLRADRAGSGVRGVGSEGGLGGSAGVPGQTGQAASGVRRAVVVGAIVEHVCGQLHVDVEEFCGRGRHKRVVLARALVAHLARQLTTQSFPEIARAMHRPNHSTVITAKNRIEEEMNDPNAPPLGLELAPRHAGMTTRELASRLCAELVAQHR
jgi:chromosomal replication initiator protein